MYLNTAIELVQFARCLFGVHPSTSFLVFVHTTSAVIGQKLIFITRLGKVNIEIPHGYNCPTANTGRGSSNCSRHSMQLRLSGRGARSALSGGRNPRTRDMPWCSKWKVRILCSTSRKFPFVAQCHVNLNGNLVYCFLNVELLWTPMGPIVSHHPSSRNGSLESI